MGKEKTAKKHATHGFTQFELTNYLLNNLSQFNISPTAKLVLSILSTFYNPGKSDMFPKQKTIAARLGVSERSVVRAIQELVKEGIILVEGKTSNHYVYTAKIADKLLQDIKNFEPVKMSEDKGQNNSSHSDNLSPHDIEQKKEQIKEPESVQDFKILKEYAQNHGAKNVTAYVNSLKKSGAAVEIIKKSKEIQAIKKDRERSIKETQELIQSYKEDAKTSVSYKTSASWLELGKKMRGNKKPPYGGCNMNL